MNAEDRIDVLIPHYENPDGLRLSLASIEAQSVGKFRVVIADDGSSQPVFADVEQIIARSALTIDLLRSAQNIGRARTRNVLLDAIDSSYTAWLDAGDEWYPGKTAAQIAVLRNSDKPSEPTWITCDYDWQWPNRRVILCGQETGQDPIRAILAGRSLRAYLWTLLAPSPAFRDVGYFDEKLPRLQDVDFFLRFLRSGGRIANTGTGEALCVYHKSDRGRDPRVIRDCGEYLMIKHSDLYDRYGPVFANSCRFELDLLIARYSTNNAQFVLAARHYLRALRRQPRTMAYRLGSRLRKRILRG